MDSREQFENHPSFKGMDFTRSSTHPEYYESPYANGAWDGWKAGQSTPVEVHDLADEWSAVPIKQCSASGGHNDCPNSALPGSQYCAEHVNRRNPWSN